MANWTYDASDETNKWLDQLAMKLLLKHNGEPYPEINLDEMCGDLCDNHFDQLDDMMSGLADETSLRCDNEEDKGKGYSPEVYDILSRWCGVDAIVIKHWNEDTAGFDYEEYIPFQDALHRQFLMKHYKVVNDDGQTEWLPMKHEGADAETGADGETDEPLSKGEQKIFDELDAQAQEQVQLDAAIDAGEIDPDGGNASDAEDYNGKARYV